jgi:hypothetical protein
MVEWSKDLYVNPNSQTTLGEYASCVVDRYRIYFHYFDVVTLSFKKLTSKIMMDNCMYY